MLFSVQVSTMVSHYPQRRTTHQPCAFIRDKSFDSYNLLFLSAIIVAGGIAEIECADSKKAPPWNHSQDGAFLLWIRANISQRNRR